MNKVLSLFYTDLRYLYLSKELQNVMKAKPESKRRQILSKERKSRELVYKLIDINQEIDSEGKTFRVGDRVYFVRELG
jgi:hypothetical protein